MKKNEINQIIDNLQREQELIQQHENSIAAEYKNLFNNLPNGFEYRFSTLDEVYTNENGRVHSIYKQSDCVYIRYDDEIEETEMDANFSILNSVNQHNAIMAVLYHLKNNAEE